MFWLRVPVGIVIFFLILLVISNIPLVYQHPFVMPFLLLIDFAFLVLVIAPRPFVRMFSR